MKFSRYNFRISPSANVKRQILSENLIRLTAKNKSALDAVEEYALTPISEDRYSVAHNNELSIAAIDLKKWMNDNDLNGVQDCVFPSMGNFKESSDEDFKDLEHDLDEFFSSGSLSALVGVITNSLEIATNLALAALYTLIKFDPSYLKNWLNGAKNLAKAILGKILC